MTLPGKVFQVCWAVDSASTYVPVATLTVPQLSELAHLANHSQNSFSFASPSSFAEIAISSLFFSVNEVVEVLPSHINRAWRRRRHRVRFLNDRVISTIVFVAQIELSCGSATTGPTAGTGCIPYVDSPRGSRGRARRGLCRAGGRPAESVANWACTQLGLDDWIDTQISEYTLGNQEHRSIHYFS